MKEMNGGVMNPPGCGPPYDQRDVWKCLKAHVGVLRCVGLDPKGFRLLMGA